MERWLKERNVLTKEQGSRVAEVAGYYCHGRVWGVCCWTAFGRHAAEGEEGRLLIVSALLLE